MGSGHSKDDGNPGVDKSDVGKSAVVKPDVDKPGDSSNEEFNKLGEKIIEVINNDPSGELRQFVMGKLQNTKTSDKSDSIETKDDSINIPEINKNRNVSGGIKKIRNTRNRRNRRNRRNTKKR